MPDIYLIIVFILFALAITDLVVGVSNDAVNFLNSAVGSKVAPRHIIMIVASLGIFVGATFSSGMMEVARKGIFNPEYFFFSEIMIIFLAVMLTDIILLDLFNTFGMPTSTTVSIVFELLGASVAISIIKVTGNGEGLGAIGEYINTSSALAIISGIFISVSIAFLVGSAVQYISRLLFSFYYEKRMKLIGGIWAGLALSTLTYFLLIKGIKGASFISDEFIQWVGANTWLLLAGNFVFWTVLMQVLLSVFKVNVLRIIVLFGTFSLAMAFAGNDLVNFIGVPIAGFESFLAWTSSGLEAQELTMESMQEPVRTKTYLLLIAGAVMILTLWFSKKARSVTETEVNLGRQDDGAERFSSNLLSRGIVRFARRFGSSVSNLIPDSILEKADQNFQPVKPPPQPKQDHPPAFDLVRASVNLTTASMLIAFATSLKLPLSTTYVSFMVAMGTSLADRAWGRDSAVYRVAGVLNVIGGWFLTAIIAFTVSGIFAFLIHWLGIWAIGGLVALAIFLISRTFALHQKKEKAKAEVEAFELKQEHITVSGLINDSSQSIGTQISNIAATYKDAMKGLLEEDLALIRQARTDLRILDQQNKDLKRRLYSAIKRIKEETSEASRLYILVYDLEQDILQSARLIVEECEAHVANSLNPLNPDQVKNMQQLIPQLDQYLHSISAMMRDRDFGDLTGILTQKDLLFETLESGLSHQVVGIKEGDYGARNSALYFSLQLETKDLVAVAARFVKLFNRMGEVLKQPATSLVTGNGLSKESIP